MLMTEFITAHKKVWSRPLHPLLEQCRLKSQKLKIWQTTKILHLHSYPAPYRCYLHGQMSHRCYLCFLIVHIFLTDRKLLIRIRNTRFPLEQCLHKPHSVPAGMPAWLYRNVLYSQQLTLLGGTSGARCSVKKKKKELHWPLSSVLGLNSSSFSSSSLLELSVFPFICSSWSKLTRPTSSKLRLTFERNTLCQQLVQSSANQKNHHIYKTKLTTSQSLLSFRWHAVT